jgi:hypothetical protein
MGMNYWHFANAFGQSLETRKIMIQGLMYLEFEEFYEPTKSTFGVDKADKLMSDMVDYAWKIYIESDDITNPILFGFAFNLAFIDFFEGNFSKDIFDVKSYFDDYYDMALNL